jgi:arylsulfatase A-like enzyme
MQRGSWRAAAGALAALAAAGAVLHLLSRPSADRLPARLTIEEPVANLSAAFAQEAVVAERAGDPVVRDGLQPGAALAVSGAHRQALVAPPPSRLRFRVRVPPGARLRFGVGVERTARREDGATGIRFAVTVDGRELWARTVDPARRRRERRWFDEEVDLGAPAEREIEIGLATTAAGPGERLAGRAGWSHVRVVARTDRDRQRAGAGPSVLVLMVDTLRADRLGCYGAAPSPSPTIDRLAREGRLFEQAISQSSWTLPAVASLLTGLYPKSHGLVAGQHAGADALAGGGGDPSFLADAIPTLAAEAVRAGVTTFGVSASPLVSRDTNLARGFETFLEFGWDGKREDWTPAAVVNRAFLDWLAENRGLRFLAYLHYMDTHDPYTPPGRPPAPPGVRREVVAGRVGPLALAVNRGGAPPLPAAEVDYLRALYDGEIAAWDAELARLLEGLAAAGVAGSTVVVLVADHGEEFQDHGKLKHGIHLYDELVRVPLVVAGPGVGAARVAAQVQGVDLFPTVATLLALAVPPGLPGQDLLGTLAPRPAFSETLYGVAADGAETALAAIRLPDWKLIHTPAASRFELFDLAQDPGERENRFGRVEAGEALAARLARWTAETPAAPAPTGRDPRLLEKLRALGYVD